MNTFLFPDVNVWLALAHQIHPHHKLAAAWERSLPTRTILCFCRFTQLGLLRLLTNTAAMRQDVLSQAQAWEAFDSLLQVAGARLIDEPQGIDPVFRRFTNRNEVSTKQWADGYLASFAETAGMKLVTFDQALAGAVNGGILLQ
jgi:toxin-antitoxin system PIN domain toxin